MAHNISVRISLPGVDEQHFQECYDIADTSDVSTKGLSAMLTKLHKLQDTTQRFLTEKINDDANAATGSLEEGYEEEGEEGDIPSPSTGPPKKKNKKRK
mmetsp:Transcript_24812/g.56005  ORF Transcript_24812/g.56005 Transcript_24812/m.56005 type:complete len:99 (+) Transcript_24812:154-450(+)